MFYNFLTEVGHFWSNLFSSNIKVCEWKHQGQNMTVACFPKKWAWPCQWPTTTTIKWVWEHSEQLSSQFGEGRRERVLYKKKGMTNDLGAKEQILNLRQYSVSVWATEHSTMGCFHLPTWSAEGGKRLERHTTEPPENTFNHIFLSKCQPSDGDT